MIDVSVSDVTVDSISIEWATPEDSAYTDFVIYQDDSGTTPLFMQPAPLLTNFLKNISEIAKTVGCCNYTLENLTSSTQYSIQVATHVAYMFDGDQEVVAESDLSDPQLHYTSKLR